MANDTTIPLPQPKKKSTATKAKEASDRADKAAKRKVNSLRRQLAEAEKRLKVSEVEKAVASSGSTVVDLGEVEKFTPTGQEHLEQVVEDDENIIFKPNPGPQTEFLAASEREVLFGGARGGSKSYGLLADPIRYINNKNHSALLIRRTMPELRDLIHKSKFLYSKVDKGARWKEQEKEWTFSSGARIKFGYCESLDDVMQFQGQAFNWIGIDEIGQYPDPKILDLLKGSLRSVDPSLPLCLRMCVDEGDVLTDKGWKDIKEIVEGDIVWSLDVNGALIKKPVTSVSSYEVDEELVRVKTRNLYMSMTNDHRVVHKNLYDNSYKITRWSDHHSKSMDVVRAPDYYFIDGNGYKSPIHKFSDNEYAEFLGLYIAEGCVTGPRNGNYKVLITQNKKENHDFVWRVMKASGLNVCYCKNGDFQITNKALFEHLKPLGKAHEKHFPREFLDKASKEQLELAFRAYALGDGHWQTKTNVECYTSSKQLSDDLQEIALKLGWKSSLRFRKLSNPNHNDRYFVSIITNCNYTRVERQGTRCRVKLESYKGKVYCITVQDTENFIIRQKGTVWVSGNTANPGGPGQWWLKRDYVDKAPHNTTFSDRVKVKDRFGVEIEVEITKRFIPATVYDNPYLLQDNSYIAMLASLPEAQRRQWLMGDWDVTDNAAFAEWDRRKHVVEPFKIPNNWTKFRACDWGYSSFACCLWFAMDENNTLYVYRELYTTKVTADVFANMVLDLEQNDNIRYGVLDASCWQNRGDPGPSIAETMTRLGCRWKPSDRSKDSRKHGKLEVHRRLAINEDLEIPAPRLRVFSTCTNLIRTFPSLPLDENNVEDVDTDAEDHAYDALRYGCMSRPINPYHLLPLDNSNPSLANKFVAADEVFGY